MRLPAINDRTRAALAALALQAALGYALIVGLGVSLPAAVETQLKLFAVGPPPPPPPPREKLVRRPVRSQRREGAASPPNLKAKATEVVAPVPIVPPILPPPVVAARDPGIGAASSAGAAPIVGPGTGAGGVGNGTGSGDSGDGDGDGGIETPLRLKKGRLKDSDYPKAAAEAGVGGRVGVRYTVDVQGRATDCTITVSSGSAELDATTCRLIEERFRYEPWRDAKGRPVPSTVTENHDWVPHAYRGTEPRD